MLYRPKFCCSCGEKIERAEWRLFSSRRFCELCETEYGIYDWVPRLALAGGLLAGIFGYGSTFYAGRFGTAPAPMEIRTSDPRTVPNLPRSAAPMPESATGTAVLPDGQSPEMKMPQSGDTMHRAIIPGNQTKSAQKSAPEAVYLCGAETKKGSPCSRKVKNGGRCWQHTGQEAILPESELRVAGN